MDGCEHDPEGCEACREKWRRAGQHMKLKKEAPGAKEPLPEPVSEKKTSAQAYADMQEKNGLV